MRNSTIQFYHRLVLMPALLPRGVTRTTGRWAELDWGRPCLFPEARVSPPELLLCLLCHEVVTRTRLGACGGERRLWIPGIGTEAPADPLLGDPEGRKQGAPFLPTGGTNPTPSAVPGANRHLTQGTPFGKKRLNAQAKSQVE